MRNNTRPTRRENVRSNLVQERYLDWLSLRLFRKKPGVDNLPRRITFDSGGTDPTLVYYGGDANNTNWTAQVGETLTKTAGTPTLNNGSPFYGLNDDSVLPDGSTYYQAAGTSFGNLSTNDIFLDGWIKGGAAGYIAYKKNGAGEGWYLYSDGTKLQLVLEDSATNTATVSGAANSLTPNQWNYFAAYVDKSDAAATGSSIFTNGTTAGAGVDFSGVGDCDSAINFTLLADNAGATGYAANVAYLSLYKGAALWPGGAGNTTLFQAIARNRCTRLTGFQPQIAKGTCEPVVQTRAFSAYTDVYKSGVRKLYHLGSDLLRMPQRYDGSKTVFGYLPEVQSTNQVPYSESIDNGAWGKTETTIHATPIAAPNGELTAKGIVASIVAGNHTIYDAVTSSAGTDTASFWAKKGDKDWIRLYYNPGTAASCYFDLDNGAVGTASNCTGYIENWGNDWYRCIVVLTGDGSGPSLSLYLAEDDGDASFAGDGSTASVYVWGIQYEQGVDYATSYVPTDAGATATRLKDQLRYNGDNIRNNQRGTAVIDFLADNYDASVSKYLLSINDGGAAADSVNIYIDPTGDKPSCTTAATAGNAGAAAKTLDVVNGAEHEIRVKWKTDQLVVSANGSDGTADSSVDIPDDIDRVVVGADRSQATQACGLITGIDIYSEFTDEG